MALKNFITKKSADILMRKPFTKENYYEFIAEREKSVKSYIKSSIIDDFRELPVELRVINDQIEELELKIRDVIASKINGQYKEFIAEHVQDKVSRRIENTLKKNPSLSLEHFSSTRKKLDYFDLQEYCDVITAKQTWEFFEPMFKNKSQVMEKFSKLGELRNGIRHSREVGEVALLEGKASIIWFNSLI